MTSSQDDEKSLKPSRINAWEALMRLRKYRRECALAKGKDAKKPEEPR